MSKSKVPKEILNPIIETVMGNLNESLNSNLLYFIFNTLASEYNEGAGEKGALQKIFIKNWKKEVHSHLLIPELKRIGKELQDPIYNFDNLISNTEGLQYEDLVVLYKDALLQVEQGFLQATAGADEGQALDE